MARTTEPTEIRRGERLEWTKSYSDYSAADYDLEYRFRGPGVAIDVTATADGTAFDAAITAAQSETLSVGKYQWQAWLTEQAVPTNTFIAGEGVITVRRGFATGETTDIDLRSTAKQIVDALEAALLGSAGREQMEYEIETPVGRRKIRYMSRSEQMSFLKYYKTIVAKENAAERIRNGGKFGKSIVFNVREQ